MIDRKPLVEVKKRMIDLDITTTGLSVKTGIPATTLSSYLSGRSIPSYSHQSIISQALSVPVGKIFK